MERDFQKTRGVYVFRLQMNPGFIGSNECSPRNVRIKNLLRIMLPQEFFWKIQFGVGLDKLFPRICPLLLNQ